MVAMNVVDVLVEKRLITPQQLAEARVESNRNGHAGRVDRALVEMGFVEEETLLKVASEVMAIPMIDATNLQVDRSVLSCLPSKLAHQKALMPIARHNGTLQVATSDPYNLYAFDELRLLTGMEIEPVLAPDYQIRNLIKTYYGMAGDTIDQMIGDADGIETIDEGDGGEGASEDLLEMAQEASVIKLVNQIMLEAISERASDIHIEPYENDLKVRYRIDGVLQDAKTPPQIKRFQAAIISRIKIMSHLNIAEKRLPQDGRIKLRVGSRQIDLRVSVIPMLFGEGVVMRVLDKASVLFTLPQLGMDPNTFARFEDQIKRPHGIILVTGPTGSGKTTTLYAALSAIVHGDIKVLTVEDPVEYNLDGVNQIQVQPKIDFTFARGLRAILRHDPDVVMIGEIRDHETAEAAIQAALTGHLVLSTLHTNDSSGAATRLIDMGVEPFLVASTLNTSMAQRLVRKVCADCKQEYEPDRDKLPRDFVLDDGATLWRGVGCRKCHQTGYRGRSGLFELMTVTDDVRERIIDRAPTHVIEGLARKHGLRLLREDGWCKVRDGITTPEEVIRSTQV
jgi:general secretion pathway protein E/type IV pilus assembly protein PilB